MTLQPSDKLSKGKEKDLIRSLLGESGLLLGRHIGLIATASILPGFAGVRSLLGESGLLLGRHIGLIATASILPGGSTGAPSLLGAVVALCSEPPYRKSKATNDIIDVALSQLLKTADVLSAVEHLKNEADDVSNLSLHPSFAKRPPKKTLAVEPILVALIGHMPIRVREGVEGGTTLVSAGNNSL